MFVMFVKREHFFVVVVVVTIECLWAIEVVTKFSGDSNVVQTFFMIKHLLIGSLAWSCFKELDNKSFSCLLHWPSICLGDSTKSTWPGDWSQAKTLYLYYRWDAATVKALSIINWSYVFSASACTCKRRNSVVKVDWRLEIDIMKTDWAVSLTYLALTANTALDTLWVIYCSKEQLLRSPEL